MVFSLTLCPTPVIRAMLSCSWEEWEPCQQCTLLSRVVSTTLMLSWTMIIMVTLLMIMMKVQWSVATPTSQLRTPGVPGLNTTASLTTPDITNIKLMMMIMHLHNFIMLKSLQRFITLTILTLPPSPVFHPTIRWWWRTKNNREVSRRRSFQFSLTLQNHHHHHPQSLLSLKQFLYHQDTEDHNNNNLNHSSWKFLLNHNLVRN